MVSFFCELWGKFCVFFLFLEGEKLPLFFFFEEDPDISWGSNFLLL